MPNKDQEFSYSKIFLSPFEYSYFKKPNGLKGQINYLYNNYNIKLSE